MMQPNNTARMYNLGGTVTISDDGLSITFAYTMRYFKTAATTGGNSTLDPNVVAIYGVIP